MLRLEIPSTLKKVSKLLKISYKHGKKAFKKCFRDAMAIVGRYEKLDLFITVTGNSKWPEIEEQLDRRKNDNCVHIMNRVFEIKLDSILKDLTERHVLGTAIGHICVIEYQQRGMSHAHICLILDKDRKKKEKYKNELDQIRQSEKTGIFEEIIDSDEEDESESLSAFIDLTKSNLDLKRNKYLRTKVDELEQEIKPLKSRTMYWNLENQMIHRPYGASGRGGIYENMGYKQFCCKNRGKKCDKHFPKPFFH